MIYGDKEKDIGVGFKFSKTANSKVIYGIDAAGKKASDVTLNIGRVQADSITDRSGKKKVYMNASGGGTLSSDSALQADGVRSNSTNFYIGVAGEVRITNKKGYNSGKSIGYLPIKASKFNSVSSRKYKANIEELAIDTIDLLKKTTIKQYNLISDLDRGIEKTNYGVILEETSEVLREGDAINVYSMVSLLWDVTKKQQEMIEDLQKEVRDLKK